MGETYTTLKVPDSLAIEIDALLARRYRGYASRAEVVKDGVRRLLEEAERGAA